MDEESATKQEPTKTPTLTPTASSKTPLSVTGPASSTTSYYLGCRKNANCNCKMCLESIYATRDLISHTHLSSKNRSLSFTPSKPKAALTQTRPIVIAPITPPMLRSTAKSRLFDGKKMEKQESFRGFVGYQALGFVVLSLVLWVVDSGLVLKWLAPELEKEVIGRIGVESRFLSGDFNGRVAFAQERLRSLVRDGAMVRDCGARNSVWKFNQGGSQFFHWRCVIYKSMEEEVSIWGSPLRTSGLLSTTLSSRHLTILSGKISEWSDGVGVPMLRSINSSSWTYNKWTSSAIQLDPDTWVLEYRRNTVFEGPRLIPKICEMVLYKMSEKVRRLKRRLSLGYYREDHIACPT